jgi:methylated-DNA-protein-cysteine methyltransferase-like protein
MLAVVARVPRGRVVTYGEVAALAGLPRHAREVGRALASLPEDSSLAWQRVVNAGGRVSPRGWAGDEQLQRRLLESEGVVFDARGRIDLERFGWEPEHAPLPPRRRSALR